MTDELETELAEQMGSDAELPSDDDADPAAPPAPEPEPEPEPGPGPPPPPPTDEVMERRFERAGRAATAYAKKIGDIFEEAALDLTPCPLCPDVHKGFVNIHDAGRVPEAVQTGVLAYFGFAREQNYNQDPGTRTCVQCDGHGKVKTGSKVPGNETHRCGPCAGYGFVPPPSGGANGSSAADVLLAPEGEHVGPLDGAERDPSGEPRILPDGRENPNFGKWPQFKIPVAPWGVTAGLRVQDAVGP